MDARRNLPARLLAGLQMGIAGGLATLIWFASVSEFHFRAPWTLINLFRVMHEMSEQSRSAPRAPQG